MRAGLLDRRIELQAVALPTDGDPSGGQWVTETTIYAEQVDKGSLKRFVSDQELASADRVYRIRYRTDVDPTWRVKDGDEYWRIDGTPEGKGRRTETLLMCSRYDPNEREFE
jgi:head-tail adaptor